jgi:hypothetical protein
VELLALERWSAALREFGLGRLARKTSRRDPAFLSELLLFTRKELGAFMCKAATFYDKIVGSTWI